ncbi:MAG: isopenicillin N synthase family dioxygenase [Thiotrichales bacterium]
MNRQPPKHSLDELNLEASIGSRGDETDARPIPIIDLSDFTERREQIVEELWEAAANIGFFQIRNHGIPVDKVRDAFAKSQAFFDLPMAQKSQYPLWQGMNAGWEYREQVRPSTGTADQKESYQITLPRMAGLWPEDEVLSGFRATMEQFEHACWETGMRVLSCFATRLGFTEDFFTRAHDPAKLEYQSTLRLLHYLPVADVDQVEGDLWRAGAHTDFDCLTMVFQKPGQGGLQVCPGREVDALAWTSVEPGEELITCNIGDMLMRWSDDQLKSTLHRVRMPRAGEYQGARYSMAFFCQANSDVIIQGPEGRYEPILAADYLKQRIAANFQTD